ncbi:MAG: type II toxin-antitoxin system Phd/YefM family antitoxin [Pseudorhodoplanes sp.]
MKHVGIFEAKTNLSRLIEQVEKGQDVVITRHGKPVAKLVRARAELTPQQIAERKDAIEKLQQIASELKINATQQEIKSWINEGRH